MCLKVRAEFRGLPCFLYGHSMGGLIAVRAGRRNPGLFSGMVLEAPLAKFHADVTTAEYVVAKLAGWLLPTARSFRDPNKMLDSVTCVNCSCFSKWGTLSKNRSHFSC